MCSLFEKKKQLSLDNYWIFTMWHCYKSLYNYVLLIDLAAEKHTYYLTAKPSGLLPLSWVIISIYNNLKISISIN